MNEKTRLIVVNLLKNNQQLDIEEKIKSFEECRLNVQNFVKSSVKEFKKKPKKIL